MDDKGRLLSAVPLFARLGRTGLAEIAALVDEVDVAAGTVLTREGRSGGEFFVIVDGAIAVERGGTVVRTLGPGEFLGEIALVDGGPRTATATATVPTRLLVLAHREFHSLMDRFPEVRMAVLQALAERVRALDARTPV
jgi:CRP/FNR family cyclic AMP-dependent transcriptional regulator